MARALAELEWLYRSAPVGLGLLDTSLRYVRVNARLAAMNGPTVEQHVGRSMREVIPALAPQVEPHVHRVLEQGETVEGIELRGTTAADPLAEHVWLAALHPFRDARGAIMGITVVIEDVTVQRRMEAALREAHGKLEFHMMNSPLAVMERDASGRIVRWSEASERVFGFSQLEVLGRTVGEIGLVEDPDVERTMAGIVAGPTRRGVVRTRNFARDGRLLHCEWYNSALRDAQGRLVSVWSEVLDVTARVEAEGRASMLQALATALARARTSFDVAEVVASQGTSSVGASECLVAVLDESGREFHVLAQLGISHDTDSRWQRIPNEGHHPVALVVRTRTPLFIESPQELAVRFPELGELRERGVRASSILPLIADGEVLGALVYHFRAPRMFHPAERAFLESLALQSALALDRTRLFEAERDARAHAESASRAKSDFLAMMSHELRTPLNAIDGYSELIELGIHGPVTAQQLEDLRRIRVASRHLLGIINGVLEQAQLESRQLTFADDVIPVSELRAEVEAIVLPLAGSRNLAFTSAPPAPGLAVRADRDRVRQVLLNLVSNALKFTECGGVRLESHAVGEHVEIAVHDTGCGIDAAQLERIFEPFVQVDSRAASRSEGVGLGLAISRDLARGMGGDLAATSTVGRGSTFTLRLPRATLPDE